MTTLSRTALAFSLSALAANGCGSESSPATTPSAIGASASSTGAGQPAASSSTSTSTSTSSTSTSTSTSTSSSVGAGGSGATFQIAITSPPPGSGAFTTNPTTVTITAEVNVPNLAAIEFYDNDILIAGCNSLATTCSWTLDGPSQNGSHALRASATDASGQSVSSAAAVVTVGLPPGASEGAWFGAKAFGAADFTANPPAASCYPPPYPAPCNAEDNACQEATLCSFETKIGGRILVDRRYEGWDSLVPSAPGFDASLAEYVTWTVSKGRIPHISWKAIRTGADPNGWPNCTNYVLYSDITSGALDAEIDAAAGWFNDYFTSHPATWFFFTFNHEPDHDKFARCNDGSYDFTGSHFVAAYNYVRARFRDKKVTNLVWVPILSGHVFQDPGCPSSQYCIESWYPGDATVDWIGVDGYNGGTNNWMTPDLLFGGARGADTFAQLHDKPLLVGETGSHEDPNDPNRKANWWQSSDPSVGWAGWLQEHKMTRSMTSFGANGWEVDSSQTSLDGFRSLRANTAALLP